MLPELMLFPTLAVLEANWKIDLEESKGRGAKQSER